MQKLLEDYSQHLAKRGLSQSSVYNYVSDLKKFLVWKKQESKSRNQEAGFKVEQVTQGEMTKYLRYLELEGLSESTRSRYRASLRKFWEWRNPQAK